jgi:hypothetical protein
MISDGFMGLLGPEGTNEEPEKGNSNKFKEP